jgi:hypothetical protein
MPIPLDTQELFEALWFARPDGVALARPDGPPLPNRWLVLFSSQRCAPCARLDKAAIEEAAGIPFYVCDATVNRYTPVYCDITRFPTFQLMEPGKVVATLTSSDTATVLEFLLKHKVSE